MNTLRQLNIYSTSSVSYTDQGLGSGQVLANRYQINGLLDTANPVLENIEKICNAAGSWLSYDTHEGKWGIVINQTGTSVASFNDSNIIGNISVSGTGLQDLYNSVKVEFPHRDLKDSADFIQIEIPSGDRNANEADNNLNLSYDIINEPVQADLLGFIELKQSRVDLVINFKTDFSYINLKAGDIISVTESRFSFSSKLFRIVTITEVQDDDGALLMEITALEYDSGVYSTADLYRYTRSDTNGIISIGSIGVPGTPQVTKYEIDARPRVLIESTAPTGVVEGLEYWLTNDVNEGTDANRSYTLIATKKPPGGGTYNSGFAVVLDYDQLNTSNFYVKTRGFNATTVGPYSDPSGLAIFTATQVTDAIGPNTKALNALGTIGTVLGVYSLIKGVDELYQKIANTSSLFTKIFETLKEQTGIDLIGDNAPSAVGTPITIRDEGNTLTTSTAIINFVGSGVSATNTGNNVTVTISGTGGGGGTSTQPPVVNYYGYKDAGASEINGPKAGGTEIYVLGSGFAGITSVNFGNIPAAAYSVDGDVIYATSPASPRAGAVNINITNSLGTATVVFTYNANSFSAGSITYLPPDRTTFFDPINNASSDTAPITGSYFIRYNNSSNFFYGSLSAGEGNVYLYKSDGTLVETLTETDLIITNNLVELPFANRELGTDYYILMDDGVVKYCSLDNPAITTPDTWNFNTPGYSSTSYSLSSVAPLTYTTSTGIVSVSPGGNSLTICPNADILITFSLSAADYVSWGIRRSIGPGSGNAYIKKWSDDSVVATIPGSSFTWDSTSSVTQPKARYKGINLDNGTAYYISLDAGLGVVKLDCFNTSNLTPALTTKSNTYKFTTYPALALSSFKVNANPWNNSTSTTTNINLNTNIELNFSRTPKFGSTGTISIYDAGATLHQAIDITKTFANGKVSELFWITGTSVIINPTKDLSPATTYYVLVDDGAILDSCNKNFGISSNTTVRFSTTAT